MSNGSGWSFADLDVVGYTDSLTGDLLPRLVVAIHRPRSRPDLLLFPPYRFEGDRLAAASVERAAALEEGVRTEDLTSVDPPIPARPAHILWVDTDRTPRYEPGDVARRHLRERARASAARARDALAADRLDEALRQAQRALAADETSIDAVLVGAVVHRRRGDTRALRTLRGIAASLQPELAFDDLVALFESGRAGRPSGSRGARSGERDGGASVRGRLRGIAAEESAWKVA